MQEDETNKVKLPDIEHKKLPPIVDQKYITLRNFLIILVLTSIPWLYPDKSKRLSASLFLVAAVILVWFGSVLGTKYSKKQIRSKGILALVVIVSITGIVFPFAGLIGSGFVYSFAEHEKFIIDNPGRFKYFSILIGLLSMASALAGIYQL